MASQCPQQGEYGINMQKKRKKKPCVVMARGGVNPRHLLVHALLYS
jgi:hypothetical protein